MTPGGTLPEPPTPPADSVTRPTAPWPLLVTGDRQQPPVAAISVNPRPERHESRCSGRTYGCHGPVDAALFAADQGRATSRTLRRYSCSGP
jgi:hypothetical protein